MRSFFRVFRLLPLVVFVGSQLFSNAQTTSCSARLQDGELILENKLVKRTFRWNNGALISLSLVNKTTGSFISGATVSTKPALYVPGMDTATTEAALKVYEVASTASSYAYLAAEVTVKMNGVMLKRVFRLYDNCPAIVCDYYLRGSAGGWMNAGPEGESLKNIEDENSRNAAEGKVVLSDKVPLSGNHWNIKSVEFIDASDYNNTMVQAYERTIYRQEDRMRGNVLMTENEIDKSGFFIVKEAPVSNSQLYYQGFDFTSKRGEITVAGLGVAPKDITDTAWVKGYSVAVGIAAEPGNKGLLQSLRNYHNHQRIYREDRDGMIVSNTWGDRNRDSRINEKFILAEIAADARMGITHLQIDDGWQVGRSSNSAFKGGSLTNIWRNPNYWNVDPVKFPNGLQKIIDSAKAKGIRISLWFNPANDSSLKYWENDADVLINQYKKYGLTMWKIDGVQVTDKRGEENYRKFLDKVTEATNHEAVFNQDITAGRRFGYHSLNTYGNFYLENRYTDWVNYYPHTTLRNLWQLSAYLPPQRFQMEFLNKWRNADKYPTDDIFAPSYYTFDYLFATTLVAQPLAFFEVSSLPPEAYRLSALLKKYKALSADLHRGNIFPLGQEPNGVSWTGFQSEQGNHGYFLIFREHHPLSTSKIATWLAKGKKIKLELQAGTGAGFTTITGENGTIEFRLSAERSFALYKYTVL